MATRHGAQTAGRPTRAVRLILAVAALGLGLLAAFGVQPRASKALTVPSATIPGPTVASVTIPSVTVTVPSVTVPSVTVPSVTVPSVPPVTVPPVPPVKAPSVTVPSVPSPSVPSPSGSVPGTSSRSQSTSGAVSQRFAPSAALGGASPVSTPAQASAGSSNGASSVSGRPIYGSSGAVPQAAESAMPVVAAAVLALAHAARDASPSINCSGSSLG